MDYGARIQIDRGDGSCEPDVPSRLVERHWERHYVALGLGRAERSQAVFFR